MNSYHGTSVYQVWLLEDQPLASQRHKHHLQVLLFEAVCCCLQTCNLYFDEHSSWYISVSSFIVRGPTIGRNTIFKFLLPEAVCCWLQTCILILMMGCMCIYVLLLWVLALPSYIAHYYNVLLVSFATTQSTGSPESGEVPGVLGTTSSRMLVHSSLTL